MIEIDFLNFKCGFTEDCRFFNLDKNYFVSNDTLYTKEKKYISYRKAVKLAIISIKEFPIEIINNIQDVKFRDEVIGAWQFYNEDKSYPLKDFLEFTNFSNADEVSDFFATKRGIYSKKSETYLNSIQSYGERVYYIYSHRIYFEPIYKKIVQMENA